MTIVTSFNSYLYDNKIEVQILDDDPTIKTRNRKVYTRPIKVYKGVDNVITLNFKNNDQKPATITGLDFTFAIKANVGTTGNVWYTTATISNVSAAIGQITIDSANIANLTQEYYNYTITYNSGALKLPTYVDDNFGAQGQLHVISSI
jgi:hypothetical protein